MTIEDDRHAGHETGKVAVCGAVRSPGRPKGFTGPPRKDPVLTRGFGEGRARVARDSEKQVCGNYTPPAGARPRHFGRVGSQSPQLGALHCPSADRSRDVRGIGGGAMSGATYLATLPGGNVPPGMAARTERPRHGSSSPPATTALDWRKVRLVNMKDDSVGEASSLVGRVRSEPLRHLCSRRVVGVQRGRPRLEMAVALQHETFAAR